MRRLLLLAALLSSACAYNAPAAPTSTTPAPDLTAPASLSLGTVSGSGANGGRATITAKVQDGHGNPVQNVTVTFSTDVGTLSPTAALTDTTGVATVAITTSTIASITATLGTLVTHTAVSPLPYVPGPAPTYAIALATSGTATAGGGVTITATATAQNGAPSPTTYAFDCTDDGTDDIIVSTNSATCRYNTVGSFQAKVTVSAGAASGYVLTPITVTAAPV
ncbi:MAG TPA: Ig-like domain-containing protein, partial [Vicinamibacterales bacterium]|nr:Ig-like domain-containing protein [Vicinamibacterales bacterium]